MYMVEEKASLITICQSCSTALCMKKLGFLNQ